MPTLGVIGDLPMLHTLALALLTLSSQTPDPPLPGKLQETIAVAVACAKSTPCDDVAGRQQCISDYESDSYPHPEAHEPHCLLDHVWCRLEWCGRTPKQEETCKKVFAACPLPAAE